MKDEFGEQDAVHNSGGAKWSSQMPVRTSHGLFIRTVLFFGQVKIEHFFSVWHNLTRWG